MNGTTCCTLCGHNDPRFYHTDQKRIYLRCPECGLIFVPERYRLEPAEELERYGHHENSPSDPAYRDFLGRLFSPLNRELPPGSRGLDFGSGPGPTLHLMFEEAGHRMRIYDPFFAGDSSVFGETYDFITATEVAEHLFRPGLELERLWSCLRGGGYLAVMTGLSRGRKAFAKWHYIRDETHVAFFSRGTFEWLAEKWNAECRFCEGDVTIFQKPD